MEEPEKRKRGRPKGRTGETWSAYVSLHAIEVLEKAAERRGITTGKYLDEIVAVLEGFIQA